MDWASEASRLGRKERELLRNGRNCFASDRMVVVPRVFADFDEGFLGAKWGLNGWR